MQDNNTQGITFDGYIINFNIRVHLLPNAKKISNIQWFLFFKIAKRFAPNLFAPYFQSHKHLQGNDKDMNMSLFSFYLLIRNMKHRYIAISFIMEYR